MNDVWYYAQDDKSVGPLTLDELRVVLSTVSGTKTILVWQRRFSNWVKAEEVPELAAFVLKPPPLPSLSPSVPPFPLALPPDLIVPTGAQSSSPQRRKFTGSIVSVTLIVMVIMGARYLTHSGGAISYPDSTSLISGKARESFVTEGITSCMKKQENDPENKSLSLSRQVLTKYCSCYMNALADMTTYGDLRAVSKDGSVVPVMKNKIGAADASCADKLRRNLLGGG